LTNSFEQSVQSVDPSFALPYWDFTQDMAEGKSIFESFMFTEQTFGTLLEPRDSKYGFSYTNEPDPSVARIQDGRWKDLLSESASDLYSGLKNAFGYLRGPWNMNPSPYVLRFAAYSPSLPTCAIYYDSLQKTDYIDALMESRFSAHSTTHGLIGNAYGCDKLNDLTTSGIIRDAESQYKMCLFWGFWMKELYRAKYITPREDCTVREGDTTQEGVSCGFVCDSSHRNTLRNEIKLLIPNNYVANDMDDDGYMKVVEFICEGEGYRIFVGDHLESASPHGTVQYTLSQPFVALFI
jgi:hypothetical protein